MGGPYSIQKLQAACVGSARSGGGAHPLDCGVGCAGRVGVEVSVVPASMIAVVQDGSDKVIAHQTNHQGRHGALRLNVFALDVHAISQSIGCFDRLLGLAIGERDLTADLLLRR